MRRGLFLSALVAGAGLVSCQIELSINPERDTFFTAGIDAAQTKVQLSEGVKTLWCAGDEISVFGTSGTNYRFSTENSGATATFRTDVEVERGIRALRPKVLYPYTAASAEVSDTEVKTSISDVQYASPGDYGSQKPLLIGKSDTDGNVSFRHASTVVRVNILSDNIKALHFKTNGGESIAGDVTVKLSGGVYVSISSVDGSSVVRVLPGSADVFAPGDYFFVIAPGTFSSGVTLSWEPVGDGVAQERKTTKVTKARIGYLLDCGDVEYNPNVYLGPALDEADVINPFKCYWTQIPWYSYMPMQKQQYIYPHMLVSYVAMQWFLSGSLEYIIIGEHTMEIPCENIGENNGYTSYHADSGYSMIQDIAPSATIKTAGNWEYLEEYMNGATGKTFMASCADDVMGANDLESLIESSGYQCLKRILESDNIIVSIACGNLWPNGQGGWYMITPNESYYRESSNIIAGYGSVSVNSKKNNKICVVGYDPTFRNVFGLNVDTRRPYGFGAGNIVMPMMTLAVDNSEEDRVFVLDDTTSSFPTAALSGTLGNFLSILMKTHPGTTLEGANTILQENYLREETFKYVDDSEGGAIKDGGLWYFFDTDKFFECEVLHKEAVDAALEEIAGQAGNEGSGGVCVELPSGYGLCYTGPGIQFEFGGTRLDMTEENRAAFEIAWKADPASVKWYFNSASTAAFGASGSVNIEVRVLDKDARLIPDISRTVTVTLQ